MSATIIQVSGLPRSGTAWLSAVLNLHPDCVAFHELAGYNENWRQILTTWDKTRFVADCSTTGFFDENIIQHAKQVAVIRNPYDCFYSSKQLGVSFCSDKWQELCDSFDDYCAFYAQKEIHYSSMFSCFRVEIGAMFDYCFGDDVPNTIWEKIPILQQQNIQVNNPRDMIAGNAKRLCLLP